MLNKFNHKYKLREIVLVKDFFEKRNTLTECKIVSLMDCSQKYKVYENGKMVYKIIDEKEIFDRLTVNKGKSWDEKLSTENNEEVNSLKDNEAVNHPKHYTQHPSGVECIEITRHMSFNLGNALKYIWRCDLKKDTIEDLKKAIWYIQDEITMREKT